MKFTKMQGCGNDYVYINNSEEKITDPGELARRMSDRHFGIGADGLILIEASDCADVRMRMFNADGSEGTMCGNGVRCVAKYVYDRRIVQKKQLSVETKAGVKQLTIYTGDKNAAFVGVDMGKPETAAEKIPVRTARKALINAPVTVGGKRWEMTCVSMGNPHAVLFVPDTEQLDLVRYGPLFERHELFPDRVNVEFVQVKNKKELTMRVWERGSGETFACGTGACAAVAAGILTGRIKREACVHLRGGDLWIRMDAASGHIFLKGPAVTVYEGEW